MSLKTELETLLNIERKEDEAEISFESKILKSFGLDTKTEKKQVKKPKTQLRSKEREISRSESDNTESENKESSRND